MKRNIKNLLFTQTMTILKNYERARDDDLYLTVKLWVEFYPECIVVHDEVPLVALKSITQFLPREDHVSRIRRKIQNDMVLYLPTDLKIRKKRKIAEEKWIHWLSTIGQANAI